MTSTGSTNEPEPLVSIDRWLRFMSTQAGRDKVYRFIQYFSRFLAHHLKKRTNTTVAAQRLLKLSMAVGLGRKRMGCQKTRLVVIFSV